MITALFRRQYGGGSWDAILRVSGLVALVSIPLVYLVPATGGMVGFALVTVWVNGPLSPIFPSTYEPILILFGRLYPPILVATVGVAGTLYVEYLNYYMYGRALELRAFDGMRRSVWVERVVKWFRRAPFFTIWFVSFTPFPYWPVRFVSPLARYDIRRHLFATLLGRFPRLWFFAAVGSWWNGPIEVLVWLSVGAVAVAASVFLAKRWWQGTGRSAPELAPVDAAGSR